MSSWNETMYKNFVAKGELLQQILFQFLGRATVGTLSLFFKTHISPILDHVGRWNFVWNKATSKNEDDLKNENILKNEDDLKNEERPPKWRRP